MAHAKRSQQHRAPSSSISSPFHRRNLRRPTTTTTLDSQTSLTSSLSPNHRPVLVPLQPNLRRLPSRILIAQKDNNLPQLMRDTTHVILAGSKRKRVASSNENAHTHGRPVRGSGRPKRLKSTVSSTTKYYRLSSSEESGSQASGMDVDTPVQLSTSDESEIGQEQDEGSEDQEEGNDEDDSTDDHLINSAPRNQLNRLRKSDLIRLYDLTGLTEDADTLTKSEIIDAIVNARDDFASVPPSSPLGRADGASSEYSSDDGNVAGDEETDFPGPRRGPHTSPTRRRATLNDLGKLTTRAVKTRNMSMSNLLVREEIPLKRKASTRSETDNNTEPSTSRRRTSTRTSPIIAATETVESPPAHRLRSRNTSHSIPTPTSTSSGTSKSKGRGKSKQVEFSDAVQVHVGSPSKRSAKGKEHAQHHPEDSDLTELEELEKAFRGQASPRRLRSKDRELEKWKGKEKFDSDATPIANSKRSKRVRGVNADEQADDNDVRVRSMRKNKGKISGLKELDVEQEETDEERDELEDDENVEADIDEDVEQEEEEQEVDELVSSASTTPPPESRGNRTPLHRRLRPRTTRNKTAYEEDAENEGDDEEDENEEDDEEAEDEVEQEDDTEEDAANEYDEATTIVVEPRKLRNGKIVWEEDNDMEVDEEIGEEDEEEEEGEEVEEEGEEAEEEAVEVADADSIDIDAEGETDEDGIMEDDDVDLTIATAKTLIRLRRDDLVRLCETRDLIPVGPKPTKPQLAEALLQWRDRRSNEFSSPSSAGTIRPSSTRRRRKINHDSSSTNTAIPVLLRSEHVHTDEPRTPIPCKDKENEELELDLESLGLEDREIAMEKLTKLEKIGSGGFKDVYIGKFRGRKIAISEFRGQLSAMDIKELKLLGAFHHPNIVRFLGVCIPENTKDIPVMIVSELCSNGDLFDYVRNVNPPSLHKVLQMALDIARGLEYLHTRKPSIIHRDCKSSNILITARGTAKIADFGLAKVKQSTRSMVRSLVGTVNWQAPELWHAHPKYNHKVDVFSCAMVYWEMLQWHLPTKKFPWEGMNEHAIYDIVGSKRQRPSIASLRKQWCTEIVDLIESMWAHEHQDRPTMSEVVETVQIIFAKY